MVYRISANRLLEFVVVQDLVNLSDHLAIFMCANLLNIQPNDVSRNADSTKNKKPRLRWDHANLTTYYDASYAGAQPILNDLEIFYRNYSIDTPDCDTPLNFYTNFEYSSAEQKCAALSCIENIYRRLVCLLNDTANRLIPVMNKTALKHWWSEELSILKQNAVESNIAWVDAGKPQIGPLANARKHDKYAYKLAIRKCKVTEVNGITNSLHESLLNLNSNNFWKVWKSKMGTERYKNKCVNGKTNPNDISQCFADYFSKACSSNNDDRCKKLYADYCIKRQSYAPGTSTGALVTADIVEKLIINLKKGKSAGIDDLTSEHLQFSHPIVIIILTKLFNIMILFEYVPNDFGQSLMVPVPKNDTNKVNVSADDYRGISLNPIISKVFEKCLLRLFSFYLSTSQMQFGFKSKTGCVNAIYTLRKTVEFFIDRESTINLCSLDLRKAFDKLNRYGLFLKLMNRNCPLVLINILECWYSKCFATVTWNGGISEIFRLFTGTRQGGVISPTLFAVYVDDVLEKLKHSRYGCHIKNICLNAFMFADDLLLASISLNDMQQMINICKDEFDWLDMSVNASKSICIRIGRHYDVINCSLYIDEDIIPWSSELRYLGIFIKSASVFKCNQHCMKTKFYRSLNGILGKLGSSCPANVVLSLIDTFCNPILLYGLEALHLNKSDLRSLSYVYDSIYMKLFTSFDSLIIMQCRFYFKQLPLTFQIDLRTLNFLNVLSMYDYNSPACIMFKLFGNEERNNIATRHSIQLSDSINTRDCLFNSFSLLEFGPSITVYSNCYILIYAFDL